MYEEEEEDQEITGKIWELCLNITKELKAKPLHSYFVNFDEIIMNIESKKYRNPQEWYDDVTYKYSLGINKKDSKLSIEKLKQILNSLIQEFHKKAKSLQISSINDWVNCLRDDLVDAKDKIEKCPCKSLIHPLFSQFFEYTDEASFKTKESIQKAKDMLKQISNENKTQLTQDIFQYYTQDFKDKMVDINNYKCIEQIGSGGFGDVYKEKDIRTNKEVAVKYINANKDLTKLGISFYREIANQSQSVHPCILPFIGFSCYNKESQPAFIIITEYQKNGSLRRLLDSQIHHPNKCWTNTRKTIVAFGIAVGMQSLHSKNILHRDLKSANILLDANLLPKISDFGLSKFIPETTNSTDENINTIMTGTKKWMAPEVMTGTNYTNKADVYSYGMLLYEILTNLRPYEDINNITELYKAALDGNKLKFYKSDEQNIIQLIKQCIQPNPDLRPTFDEIVHSFLNEKSWFSDTIPDQFYLASQYFLQLDDIPISFSSAVERNMLEVVRRKCIKNPNQSFFDMNGKYCLHVAILKNSLQMLNLLLSNKLIYVNVQDSNGMTPLHLAVINDLPQFVLSLLTRPNINPNILDNSYKAPIHYAVDKGNSCLTPLLTHQNLDVNIKTNDGSTPIYLATDKMNMNAILALLSKPVININIGPKNETPLVLASLRNYYEILLLFIASGKAKMDLDQHIELFFNAILVGNVRVVSAMLQSPTFDINKKIIYQQKEQTALECAFNSSSPEMVMILLAQPHINLKSEIVIPLIDKTIMNQSTSFLYACIASNKIDFNVGTEQFPPPLFVAVFSRNINAIKALLTVPDINVNNTLNSWPKYTALHYAVQKDNIEIVKLLLQSPKINKDIAGLDKVTPRQLARKDNKELINLLSSKTHN